MLPVPNKLVIYQEYTYIGQIHTLSDLKILDIKLSITALLLYLLKLNYIL